MPVQVKSKQRVTDHGEVFTAEREVNAMLDLVKQETERVDSRFLEPACGDGNFLTAILKRKLVAAQKRSIPPRKKYPIPSEYEKQSLIALSSIYGIDLLEDNVIRCRDRLLDIWSSEYKSICKPKGDDLLVKNVAKFILSKNIVCGNALSLMTVDNNQQDTEVPIIFSEWTLPFNDSRIQRKEYIFAELVDTRVQNVIEKDNHKQMELFDHVCSEGHKPILMKQYIFDYRRVKDYDR